MNNWTGIGNLTKDPELRYSTGGNQTAICRFTVAINDGYGDKAEVSYIPVTAFGKTAENCEKYLAKGRKVAVQGRIKTGSYEKDGRKIYTTDIIASRVEFIGGTQGEQTQSEQQAINEHQGFMAIDESDIPF